MRVIDNFDVLMAHMDFVDPNDRYIVHIMRRPKDCKVISNALGSNEAQRLIRTYYIDNIEYLKGKIAAIKELCHSCNARAYLIVSPKDNFDCLLNLGKKILETIQMKNFSVKPEHLLRQAYCENHKSRKKQWIIDLDNDQMVEKWVEEIIGRKILKTMVWTVNEVFDFVRSQVEKVGKCPDDVYRIPTRNGWHIISPPFNLQAAYEECRMMFEGNKRLPVQIDYNELTGWLHKDGMTLLYCEVPEAQEGNENE